MKKAEKVEMKVMVTDRSRLPPNITVQMFEAPPPGLHPVTEGHDEDQGLGKLNGTQNSNKIHFLTSSFSS